MKLDGKKKINPHCEEFYFQTFCKFTRKSCKKIFWKIYKPLFILKYDDSNMIRSTSAQDIETELKKRF